MKPPRVVVRQGACRLNDLWLVHQGPGFMHLRGDMRAKYAEVQAFSGTSFFIGTNERTLYMEPKETWWATHGMTEVALYPRGGRRWACEAAISRYTLEVFCYTADKSGRFVWGAEDERATSRCLVR